MVADAAGTASHPPFVHEGGTGPALPYGRRVELPERGTTFVREVPGPAGAPTVLLLHGLTASAGLNWFNVFEPLSKRFNVVAPDLRGHGRGLRSRKRFRLADCADDVAASMEELGIESAIVAGYSMGGPVAQLLWRRHPEKVSGLVFCATSDRFVVGVRERTVLVTAASAAAGSTRLGGMLMKVPSDWFQRQMPGVLRERPSTLRSWAAAEMRRHDWRLVSEAALAIGNYNASSWIDQVDVPTSVLVTTKDRAVPPSEQARLALAIGPAKLHRVDDGHAVCARRWFHKPFGHAVADVASRL